MNTNIVFTRDCAVGLKEKLEDVPFVSLYLLADSNTSRFSSMSITVYFFSFFSVI